MEILFTEQFELAYAKLIEAEKQAVRKALIMLGDNLQQPSLHVKKMGTVKNIWEVRPSQRLQMTFEMAGETIIMRNVGEHDKVLKSP